MGAISESDIDYFLLDLSDILNNFKKLYLGDEYKNINKNAKEFFNKINGTYILKLYKSIHMVALKFSTILTKYCYEQFENNIYKQYNDIVNYIYENSDIIEIKKNNFIDLLNIPSNFIGKLFNISYNQVKTYYFTFQNLIQNQMKYISEKEYKEYKSNKLRQLSIEDLKQLFKDIYESVKKKAEHQFQELTEKLNKKKDEIEVELETSISIESTFFKIKNINYGENLCLNIFSFDYTLPFPFSLGYFQLVIIIEVSVDVSICIDLGVNIDFKKSEYSFYIDAYGKFEPALKFDIGIYYKDYRAPVYMSLNVGLKGVISSVRAGIKLDLYLTEEKFETDIYFIYKPFEFTFYIKMGIYIEIKLSFFKLSFAFEFYIYQTDFFSLKYEIHRLRGYKYNCEKLSENKYRTKNDLDFRLFNIKKSILLL